MNMLVREIVSVLKFVCYFKYKLYFYDILFFLSFIDNFKKIV